MKRLLGTILLAVGMILSPFTAGATEFIKDVMLIGGSASEVNPLKSALTAQGWTLIDYDLNKGAGGDYIYLLYKSEEKSYNKNYITDFIINNSSSYSDEWTYDGRTYHLVDYDGGNHFKNVRGDLNSNAGGADIHLYYTRDLFTDDRTVTGIYFNTTQGGGVGTPGSGTGYDLNRLANGDYVYMHIDTIAASPPAPDPANGMYDLWLGNTRVTTTNRDNILNQTDGDGNPTAVYDGTAHLLTLNNPTISGCDPNSSSKIYATGMDLTLEGSYSLVDSNYDLEHGLRVDNGTLTVTGDFTFDVDYVTPVVADNLVLRSGNLTIEGYDEGIECNSLIVESGFTRLDVQGDEEAILANDSISIAPNFDFLLPTGGHVVSGVIRDQDDDIAHHVILHNVGTKYNLWLGGVRVTDYNKDNILDQTDGNGSPTARYNSTTHVLTLNNPTIEGRSVIYDNSYGNSYYKIYATDMNLTFAGSYSLVENACDYECMLKVENGTLTIQGDFTFSNTEQTTAIWVDNLVLRSGTLTVVGDYFGIEGNSLSIENSFTRLEVQGRIAAIYVNNSISMGLNLALLTPAGGRIHNGRILVSEVDNATHVVIANPGTKYNLWLGGVQVSEANKDNILSETSNGSPTAQYNPTTHVLTLNNPTINGYVSDKNCKIYSTDIDLTIEGSCDYTDNSSYYYLNYGLRVDNGMLTIAGDITLDMPYIETAIKADSITLHSGTFTVVGGMQGINCPSITIESTFSRLEVQGSQFAFYPPGQCDITMGEHIYVTTPERGELDGFEQHVVIVNDREYIVPYQLWIGDVQVHSLNKGDILNQEAAQYFHFSTASYDSDAKVLTLYEPIISGSHNGAKIYSGIKDLTINGMYRMTEADTCGVDYGFMENCEVENDLVMDGYFVFYGKKTGVQTNEYTENLTLKGSEFKAFGFSEYGLCTERVGFDGPPTHVELRGGQQAFDGEMMLFLNNYKYSIHLPERFTYDNMTGLLYEADGSTTKHIDFDVFEKQGSLVPLFEESDTINSDFIDILNSYGAPFTELHNRTIYRDGNWNTLVLPFEQPLASGILEGAEARTVSSASFDNGTLTLTFSDPVTCIMPGVPYIIRWTPAREWNLYNPVFRGNVYNNTKNNFTSADGKISFLGTYDCLTFSDEDRTILFLGSDNTLSYPESGAAINSCRAYFKLNEGITAGLPAGQWGDVNGDNHVSVSDLTTLVNIVSGKVTTYDATHADVNENGSATPDSDDIDTLADIMVGKASSPTKLRFVDSSGNLLYEGSASVAR